MDSEEPSSALRTTWGRIVRGHLVLQPIVLALGIGLGMGSQMHSGCMSIPVLPWKPDSGAEERPRSNFGIREPG